MATERPGVLLNTLPEGVLRCHVPQITVVHDLIPLAFPRDYSRQQFYFRRLVPAILRESHTVIAVSQATRREVIATYGLPPERVRAIPNGYDAEFVPVVIAGNGPPGQLAELRRLAEKVGSRLELMPYVSQQAMPALYRGARLLAMPSLAEGFGLPALEAMACGTPVVAGNRSAMPEVVGDAGLLVDPEDTAAISDAILRLLTQESLRKDLVARGLARAATFSWEPTAREVLAVLDEAAAS